MKKRLKRLLQLSKSISHALPKTRAYWLLAGATLLPITLGMLKSA